MGQKRTKTTHSSDDFVVDRITNLHESIISVILSFLPTKTAVRTSVLSKRWRFLWTTVYNLDFCHKEDECHCGTERDRGTPFARYVNRVLLLQNAGFINKFSLEWVGCVGQSLIDAWVSTALVRNVQELYVNLHQTPPPIQMPIRTIFTSERLLSLHINCEISISSAMTICLPRLVTLKLIQVEIQNSEAFQQLVCGCPVLKYLFLFWGVPETTCKYVVSSPSLIKLSFYVVPKFKDPNGDEPRYGLELETPSLELLELDGPFYWITVRGSLRSLRDASFRILSLWDYSEFENNYCNSIVLAIRAMNSAEKLFLPGHLIWVLCCATIRLYTKFERLKQLTLGATYPRYYYGSSVLDFIQHTDSLESLTIYMEHRLDIDDFPDLPSWKDPEDVPVCLANTLKTIYVAHYYGSEEEYAMIDYMLQNGSVLELMEIHVRETDQQLQLIQDICELSRKSPSCKVKFKF